MASAIRWTASWFAENAMPPPPSVKEAIRRRIISCEALPKGASATLGRVGGAGGILSGPTLLATGRSADAARTWTVERRGGESCCF